MVRIISSSHYRLNADIMTTPNLRNQIHIINRIKADNNGKLSSNDEERLNELEEEDKKRNKLSSQSIIDVIKKDCSGDTLNVLLYNKSNNG